MFYFTRNHVWKWNEIISAAEIISKFFSDIERVGKYLRAAISLWNNSEIISGKFPRAEIKLFKSDVNKGWNNFEIFLFYMCPLH